METMRKSRTLKPLCTFEFAQFTIECPDRQMAILSRNFHDEIVRETECRPFAKFLECCLDRICVLNRELRVIEKHFNRSSDLL